MYYAEAIADREPRGWASALEQKTPVQFISSNKNNLCRMLGSYAPVCLCHCLLSKICCKPNYSKHQLYDGAQGVNIKYVYHGGTQNFFDLHTEELHMAAVNVHAYIEFKDSRSPPNVSNPPHVSNLTAAKREF